MNRLLQYFPPTKRQDQQDSGIHSHNHNVKANTIYSLVILVTSTTKLIDKEIEYNMWNKLKKYGMQHDSSSFLQLFVKTTTSAYFFHGFIEGKKKKEAVFAYRSSWFVVLFYAKQKVATNYVHHSFQSAKRLQFSTYPPVAVQIAPNMY